ncbi:MAG: alpha-amylase family glycosyl hydrolase [Clostridium sp.]|nr:alpha-amylase family glycosyl hydrolase [Clostridium sp.]
MKERQVIFQAWMWKLNNIPVEEVKRQGFTAIQTSPLQLTKEKIHENLDNAWAIYQPINYDIGNDLGTEEDLKNLADRCHANGLKLIVDVVFHHVANERGNDIYYLVPDEYRHFYNDSFINISNYNSEYELTHMSLDGLPALNLENETIVNAQFNYLKQLRNAGVDGVRVDAYKHLIKSYRVRLAEKLRELNMIENSYGEVIFADKQLQSSYNEIALYVNQSLNNGSQYGAIISHDDFKNSENPYLRRDPNYFLAEYGYFMDNSLRQNVVYFCRPDDHIWKMDNIRYINARR